MICIEELICGFIVGLSIGVTGTMLAIVLHKFHVYEASNKEIFVNEKPEETSEEKEELKESECRQTIAD